MVRIQNAAHGCERACLNTVWARLKPSVWALAPLRSSTECTPSYIWYPTRLLQDCDKIKNKIVTEAMKGAMIERTVASAKQDKRKQSSGSESEESDDLAAALEKRKRQKQLDRAWKEKQDDEKTIDVQMRNRLKRMPEPLNNWPKHETVILYFAFWFNTRLSI